MMSTLRFELFGKFSVQRDAQSVKGLDASKERELLGYLLVRRERCHPRETLASLLWGDTSTERSRKYLRQALWRLQSALDAGDANGPQILLVDHNWVQVNTQSELWLDVASFEQAFTTTQNMAGKELDESGAQLLKEAVKLYTGDLLDGWYQDWCLFERERLQNIYLSMLDKLVTYSEVHREYEDGQSYGAMILRYDRARERTHFQLMHLHHMAGDRTGALRQYQRCVTALDEELGVKPDRRTKALYEYIRSDGVSEAVSVGVQSVIPQPVALPEVLGRLRHLQVILAAVQKRLQRDVKAVEQTLEAMKE
jgi:DNA-binding SARP family transcriptional activator